MTIPLYLQSHPFLIFNGFGIAVAHALRISAAQIARDRLGGGRVKLHGTIGAGRHAGATTVAELRIDRQRLISLRTRDSRDRA